MSSFMDTIYDATIRGFGENKTCWKLDRNKGFIFNKYYSLLVGSNDCCFHGKVFGSRRYLLEWHSLFGLLL